MNKEMLLRPQWETETNWLNNNILKKDFGSKKFLYVYLWSISCSHCKEVLPEVLNLYKKNIQKSQLLYIHIPMSEKDLDNEEIQKVANELGINEPVLLDNDHKWISMFESEVIPSFYVYDENENLIRSKIGILNIKNYVKSLLL